MTDAARVAEVDENTAVDIYRWLRATGTCVCDWSTINVTIAVKPTFILTAPPWTGNFSGGVGVWSV